LRKCSSTSGASARRWRRPAQRHHAGARAARGKPRHLDRNEREQSAHRQAKALAREEAFLVQIGAERGQPLGLGGGAQRITGSAASAFSRFSASPERSPSASATSSVKLTTQPSVTSG
jgi:hypothetical protein